jgi:hypothetical protein
MRVVNDPISVCREKAAEVLLALARRTDPESFKTLLDYATTWLFAADSDSNSILLKDVRSLVRTGSQIAGLLIQARPDLVKKASMITASVESVRKSLQSVISATASLRDDDEVPESELENAAILALSQTGSAVGGVELWASAYHLLLFLEKVLSSIPSAADAALTKSVAPSSTPELMCVVQEALLYPHSWVRIAATRCGLP